MTIEKAVKNSLQFPAERTRSSVTYSLWLEREGSGERGERVRERKKERKKEREKEKE